METLSTMAIPLQTKMPFYTGGEIPTTRINQMAERKSQKNLAKIKIQLLSIPTEESRMTTKYSNR